MPSFLGVIFVMTIMTKTLPLLLLCFCLPQLVNAAVNFTVLWTISGVLQVSQEITLRQGDDLVLTCPPDSFSNAVLLDEAQWTLCNSTATPFQPQLLDFCDGSSSTSQKFISISPPTFVVGTNYIASLSDGTSLAEAMRTSPSGVFGGECGSNLRLTLNVQSPPMCTVPPSPVVVVSNEASRILTWGCEMGFVPSDTEAQLTSTCEVPDVWVPPIECLVEVPGGCGVRFKWDINDGQNNMLLVNRTVQNLCLQCIYSPPLYDIRYTDSVTSEVLFAGHNSFLYAVSYVMGVFVLHDVSEALPEGFFSGYICTRFTDPSLFDGPTFFISDNVFYPPSITIFGNQDVFEELTEKNVIMQCAIRNRIRFIQFTWYLDNAVVRAQSLDSIIRIVSPITLDDGGLYRCEAYHPTYNVTLNATRQVTVRMIPRVRFGFEQTVYTVNELEGSVTLNILAFDNVTRLYPLNVFIANGTATEFNDFLYLGSTTLEFDLNAVAFQINISIYYDLMLEGTEEFFVHLSSDFIAVLYENNLATIRIVDGDSSFTRLDVEPLISVNSGANLLLLCNASYPAEQNALDSMTNILWSTEIDGVDISNQNTARRERVITVELQLSNVSFRFCGIYSCSATDRFTSLPSTNSTNLDINTAPVIISSPMDVEVLPNSIISFECVIVSEPGSLVNVTWFGPDPLPSFETTRSGDMIQTNITVSVQNGSNAGLPYNCSAHYFRCTTRASASAIFSIIVIPIIIELPQNHIGRYLSGNNSILCIVTVSGALSISWIGPSRILPETTVTAEGNKMSVLTFDQLQYSEGGEYTCVASNEAGSVNASATLFVEPQIFRFPSDGLVQVEEIAVLMCIVQDDQFVSVQWQKQNTTFEDIPGEIERNLTFSSIEFGDEGAYRCIVTTIDFGVQIADEVLLTVKPQAIIAEATRNQEIDNAETATLICTILGGPINTIQWQFNSIDILGEMDNQLTLFNISASNGGLYTCTVTNAAGSSNDSTYLFVNPYFLSPPISLQLIVGFPATFVCDAEAFPDPEFQWVRVDGELIRMDVDSTARDLVFSTVSFGDEGEYYCNASSLQEVITSAVATLTIAPDEVNITGSIILAKGDNLTLTCSNFGGPDNMYNWEFNDTLLPEEAAPNLQIEQVDSSDGGIYTCTVTNRAGNNSNSISLSIEPYITMFPQLFIEAEVDSSAILSCMADGFPEPVINWLKISGFGVIAGMEVIASSHGILEFVSLSYEDNGTYVCEASAQSPSGIQLQSARTPDTVVIVTCALPLPPMNGMLGNISSQNVGSMVQFWCDLGYRPSAILTSTCNSTAQWDPPPEELICTFIEANLTLIELPRVPSRPDIECPGDVIAFTCIVNTNSENPQLTWQGTSPGMIGEAVTFNSSSELTMVDLGILNVSLVAIRMVSFLDTIIESRFELRLLADVDLNQTLLMCSSENFDNRSLIVDVNLAVPHAPTGFLLVGQTFTIDNVTVTFVWNEPQGSGPEAVVDYYSINIVPSSLSYPNSTAITTMPFLNVTIEYNVVYIAALTATNCAGISESAALPENFTYVNCGDPMAPINGTIDIPINTRLGASVHYRCDDGYRPSANFTSTCESSGNWIPLPENHVCIFVRAMVTITELPRNNSRNDIECPGDILPYMCSVRSNSETIELSWQITFPGQDTIYMFIYTNDSERNVAVYRPMNLTAKLTQYEPDQDVQSVLELTVLRNVSINGTLLECRSEDLASENVTVIVNTSIPLIPSGVAIGEEYYSDLNLTIKLEWDEPQASGPENVVDYYIIAISPQSLFPSSDIIRLSNSPQALNITLSYNTNYTILITAENCAGESESLLYPNVTRYVNCGILQPPVNGSIDSHDHTREGISVNYRCDDGFRPSANFTTRCESTQLWTPLPRDHDCTFVSATILLARLSSSFSRTEIHCPGDTITYECSIESNSETVQLVWLVTLPGQETLSMSFVDGADVNITSNLGMNITAMLTQYIMDELIESIITLTVLRNVSINNTLIECKSENLGRELEILHVNSLVPLIPIGFNITDEAFTTSNVTVLFEWNEPVGSASEGVVDNYIVTVNPMPLHPLSIESVLSNSSRRFETILDYNTLYTVSIFAENCAGQSEVYLYPGNALYINCGNPVPPDNGTVDFPEYTREGASVEYRCNNGFRPSRNFTSTCTSTAQWTPLPQNHICEFVTARIIVTALERNPSRDNIECPGDRLPYMCSVRTNSETVEVEWRITFPGQDTIIMIIFMNDSALNTVDYFPMNVTATLTQFIPNEDVLSTLMLTVLREDPVDGTILECRSGGLASDNITVVVNISVPLVPTKFNITNVFYTDSNLTITFEWESPRSSGAEAVVDYYIITISPSPLSPSSINILPNSVLAFNATLDYNTVYTASIAAENCAGRSNTYEYPDLIRYVNCDAPKPPVNGSVDTPDHTREGASVDYRCDEGFRPSANFTSTCKSTESWTPLPENHTCTFVRATLTLTLLQRTVSRSDIDCPGDTIHYRCSVQSNSEMVQLQWIVTFPSQSSITILHTNNSLQNTVDMLGMNITSILTDYQMDELITSNLTIAVLQNVSMNGTLIECRSEELDAAIKTVYVNTSVPLVPYGFNITAELYDIPDLTITFEWDSPRGTGPEVIVDSYIITITPRSLSSPEVSILAGSYLIWNVTLNYNTNYMATITAENCAGQSETYVYPSRIEYVSCGNPIPPTNGSVDIPDHTREGSTLYYRCSTGFRPSADFRSICESTALWTPPPQNHNCTLIAATVRLFPLQRNTSRQDIECPGDTIPYRCFVESNSENVQLKWLITFPGYATVIMRLYNDSSELNATQYLPMNITSILTDYVANERVESEIVLTILRNVSMNGTIVECRSEELASVAETVYINTSVPLVPSGFNIVSEFYTASNLTIMFEWIEPQGIGPEAVVDSYTVEISPMPLFPQGVNVLPNFPRNFSVTFSYNTIYIATITAENCVGKSEDFVYPNIRYVNCGVPLPPINGTVGTPNHTREGATVDFRCDDGFRPSANFTSTCSDMEIWIPLPENHRCTTVIANITLLPLERRISRIDIECPGDIVPYSCSVQSNSENIMLTWLVTFPGQSPLTITYTNFSSSDVVDFLGMNISSIVTDYVMGNFLESVLELTVIQNVSINGTIVACSSEADSEMAIVYVNTSVPLTPSGLSITEIHYTVIDAIVTFEWYGPEGRGPEAIVDDYTINISPRPVSPSSTITMRSSPLNVTLSYNTIYTATITAINCAGESEAFTLSDIVYVSCGEPIPPTNGTLGFYPHTGEGTTVTFQCNAGYAPSVIRTSMCSVLGRWMPPPEDHTCTLAEANVTLDLLESQMLLNDIHCPGDTISYICSIDSNTENLNLTWRVHIPFQQPIEVTYDDTARKGAIDVLDLSIRSTLMEVRPRYIQSALTVVVTSSSMNRTRIDCFISNLDFDMVIVLINTSEPLYPVNLNIANVREATDNVVVFFEWQPPSGIGPEYFIQSYNFSIKSESEYYSYNLTHAINSFNATLNYAVNYTASIVSINCAGESFPLVLSGIYYDRLMPPANAGIAVILGSVLPIFGFLIIVQILAAFTYVHLTKKSKLQRRLKRKLAPLESDTTESEVGEEVFARSQASGHSRIESRIGENSSMVRTDTLRKEEARFRDVSLYENESRTEVVEDFFSSQGSSASDSGSDSESDSSSDSESDSKTAEPHSM